MSDIYRHKVVPYRSAQMYALVNDVGTYSAFVPYCAASEVVRATPDTVEATLTFARGGLHKSFTTLNHLHPHHQIEICLVNGPFKKLEGFWRFEDIAVSQCCVSLDLKFEFSSRLIGLMFGPLFHQVATLLVDAFCQRANQVYGGGQ